MKRLNKNIKRHFDMLLIKSYANKSKSIRLKLFWFWLMAKNK